MTDGSGGGIDEHHTIVGADHGQARPSGRKASPRGSAGRGTGTDQASPAFPVPDLNIAGFPIGLKKIRCSRSAGVWAVRAAMATWAPSGANAASTTMPPGESFGPTAAPVVGVVNPGLPQRAIPKARAPR